LGACRIEGDGGHRRASSKRQDDDRASALGGLEKSMAKDEFSRVREAVLPLADLRSPWFVAGGWAVDLWAGRLTRAHKDVDIAIARGDAHEVRALLRGWSWQKASEGLHGRLEPWGADEPLGPRHHELHAYGPGGRTLEFLLEEGEGTNWAYRRDARVALPRAAFGKRSAAGLMCVSPAIVLLYKAKEPTADDQADFKTLLPLLDAPWRTWLKRALELCHPGRRWARQL
jgi:hypothetical protein